jgi:hypothetical protein
VMNVSTEANIMGDSEYVVLSSQYNGMPGSRMITGWITLYNPFPIEPFSSSPDGEAQLYVCYGSLHPTATSLAPPSPSAVYFRVLQR